MDTERAEAVAAGLAYNAATDALRVQIEARRRIVRAVRARGSNAHDVRDAAHEATHGLTLTLSRWDRQSVNRALMRLRPRARMGHEVTARAVEAVVCARFGEDHSVEENATLTAWEAARDGVAVDAAAFAAKVRAAMATPQVMEIAERVCAMGDEG